MNNNIEAGSYLYLSLFEKFSTKHIVPTLQRPYVWTDKKEVKKFLEDIINNEKNYFIGSLVFVSSPEGSVGRDEIIDGQQRIITISLILIAIRDIINEKKKEKELDSVLRKINFYLRYIDSFDEKKITRIKFSDKNTNYFFNQLLEGSFDNTLTEAQKRMRDNYIFILKELRDLLSKDFINQANAFLSKIETLRVIGIKCDNNAIAYELFESINATGMSLASVDLIKNFLFRHSANNKNILSKVEKNWQRIEEIFAESRSLFKSFLRHQWISGGEYVNHSALYRAVEEKYKNKEFTTHGYTKELLNDAEAYLSLRSAEIESLKRINKGKRFEVNSIKEVLEFLAFLNVDQVYAPILFFYKNENRDKFKKYLNRLVAFQFLYKYIPGSPSSAEKIFADFPKKNKNVNNNFQNLIKLVDNSVDIFKENFSEKTIYRGSNNGDLQFVLERYVFSKDGPKSFREPTIEHIISQSEDKEKYCQKIGNLTIFERRDNSVLPENFQEKIPYYKKSKYSEHHDILKYDFNKNYQKAIQRRTEDIAIDVYDIFMNILKTGKIK